MAIQDKAEVPGLEEGLDVGDTTESDWGEPEEDVLVDIRDAEEMKVKDTGQETGTYLLSVSTCAKSLATKRRLQVSRSFSPPLDRYICLRFLLTKGSEWTRHWILIAGVQCGRRIGVQ
jgi:hypothetical protein